MLQVIYGGVVVLQFVAHKVCDDFGYIVTRARKSPPPVPVLAAVTDDAGVVLGFVSHITPEKMERWRLVLEPTEAAARITSRGPVPIFVPARDEAHLLIDLRELLSTRVWETIAALTITVEELAQATDEELLAIGGVGPVSLRDIRAACAVVLKDVD